MQVHQALGGHLDLKGSKDRKGEGYAKPTNMCTWISLYTLSTLLYVCRVLKAPLVHPAHLVQMANVVLMVLLDQMENLDYPEIKDVPDNQASQDLLDLTEKEWAYLHSATRTWNHYTHVHVVKDEYSGTPLNGHPSTACGHLRYNGHFEVSRMFLHTFQYI